MPASSHDLPVLAELQCPSCGWKSYVPAGERVPPCADCGQVPHVVETFRDRRRVDAPVKRDRRRPSDPELQQPDARAS